MPHLLFWTLDNLFLAISAPQLTLFFFLVYCQMARPPSHACRKIVSMLILWLKFICFQLQELTLTRLDLDERNTTYVTSATQIVSTCIYLESWFFVELWVFSNVIIYFRGQVNKILEANSTLAICSCISNVVMSLERGIFSLIILTSPNHLHQIKIVSQYVFQKWCKHVNYTSDTIYHRKIGLWIMSHVGCDMVD